MRSSVPRFAVRVILLDPAAMHVPLRPGQIVSVSVNEGEVDVALIFDPSSELSGWLLEMERTGSHLSMLMLITDGETMHSTMRHISVASTWFRSPPGSLMEYGATLRDITAKKRRKR